MFERVKFNRDHVKLMLEQNANIQSKLFFSNVNYDVLENLESFTGMLNGKPAVCGGIVPLWNRRGYIWTILDASNKGCFVPIFRGIKSFLNDSIPNYNRLEIAVPTDFKSGMRRALLLGFKMECERAKKYLPDGTDASLFVYLGGA